MCEAYKGMKDTPFRAIEYPVTDYKDLNAMAFIKAVMRVEELTNIEAKEVCEYMMKFYEREAINETGN